MEQDEQKVLHEAQVLESLEKHPGWMIVLDKMDVMLADATEKLDSVPPTKVDEVLAAHRDWRAVKQVRETLLRYIKETKEVAAQISANKGEPK